MEQQDILIRNGHVIDTRSNRNGIFDIHVKDGLVGAVESPGVLKASGRTIEVDASNKLVMPGFIDIHVHLREPGQEWKETLLSGATAAVAGGFTGVCCMPNTLPAIDSAETAAWVVRRGHMADMARIYPIGAVTIGRLGKKLAPLEELAADGCVAFSDDGAPVFDAGIMRRALEIVKDMGTPITCHEEVTELTKGGCANESPRTMKRGLTGMPSAAEDIMIARDIELARLTGAHVHICHISSARGVELVRRAKEDNIKVTTEVSLHHLLFTDREVVSLDPTYKMSPPLRGEEDVAACWEGLVSGVIDVVASDHAPHEIDTKTVPFPEASFGILGLQTTAPLLYDFVRQGKLSIERFVECLTDLPAKLFNLPGGTLSVGSPADITIFDPESQWVFDESTNYSKSTNSPWWGAEMHGRAWCVVVGGMIKMINYSVSK
jgi:dihydroorotase